MSSSSSGSAKFTATIPSTTGNPFLSSTSLPEGTLFIAVGSILLGIILTVLIWRIYYIWASHRAAKHNESHFTALEPSYGGPFKDPVVEHNFGEEYGENGDYSDAEKGPELHPTGVPLNPHSKSRNRPRRPRPKSQVDRLREAQLQGKFFSPTAEVLTHGTGLPSNLALGAGAASSSSSASYVPSSRLSIMHSGRNSLIQHTSMSSDAHESFGPPTGPLSGPSSRPLSGPPSGPLSGTPPLGPPEGTSNPPKEVRQKKLRPPSTYLDDLVG